MPSNLLIVRNPGPWPVPAQAVASALPDDLSKLPREEFEVNTQPFADAIEQGDWTGQALFLAEKSTEILARAAALGDTEIHYFGLAEVPHIIALGAFIGDQVPVSLRDYNRDAKLWVWPETGQTLNARVVGLPGGEPIPASGSVVLRVEVSFAISDEDVRAAAGSDHLAQVRVLLAEGKTPSIGVVRSLADVQAIRVRIREAIAGIRTQFPNLDAIHVFAATPVSVSFALGQELAPRNSPPIQTYRYRKADGQPAYTPALELSSQRSTEADEPLTEEEAKIAANVREVWRVALKEVETFAAGKAKLLSRAPAAAWYELLEPIEPLRAARPFPPLPPVSELVPQGASVDNNPVPTEYGYTKPKRTWHLSDRLLLAFHQGTAGVVEDTKRLIRLFLFHEYLHDFHSLTKYRATGVGAFPNCLEHIDYTADSYAIIHQLDLQSTRDHSEVDSEEKQRRFLARQVELVVGSFWAFQPKPPIREWQVRRLRRYFNWYWRLVQIGYAKDLVTVLRLLSHPPHVEITGIHQWALGQRVNCRLDRIDGRSRPELSLVLENHKLLRVPDSTTSNIGQLLVAFQNRDHDAIVKFFLGVYELADDMGGALPIH